MKDVSSISDQNLYLDLTNYRDNQEKIVKYVQVIRSLPEELWPIDEYEMTPEEINNTYMLRAIPEVMARAILANPDEDPEISIMEIMTAYDLHALRNAPDGEHPDKEGEEYWLSFVHGMEQVCEYLNLLTGEY